MSRSMSEKATAKLWANTLEEEEEEDDDEKSGGGPNE